MGSQRASDVRYDANDLLKKTWLRFDEAAFLLEVSPRTVDRYLTDQKLSYIRTPGGQRRVLNTPH